MTSPSFAEAMASFMDSPGLTGISTAHTVGTKAPVTRIERTRVMDDMTLSAVIQ